MVAATDLNLEHRLIESLIRDFDFSFNLQEAMKLFIYKRRFKIVKYLRKEFKPEFDFNYVNIALESDSFDILFYLLFNYEEEVLEHSKKYTNSIILTLDRSNQFLEEKLFWARLVFAQFSFSQVEFIVDILKKKLTTEDERDNLLIRSPNLLKSACLVYELADIIQAHHVILQPQTKILQERLITIAVNFTDQIENEKELRMICFEKDLENRDIFSFLAQYEMSDILVNKNIEKVVQQMWSSSSLS